MADKLVASWRTVLGVLGGLGLAALFLTAAVAQFGVDTASGTLATPTWTPTPTATPLPCPPACGLDFSIGADAASGADGTCDSSGAPTNVCNISLGARFNVNLYLHSLPASLVDGYTGYDAVLQYSAITASETKASLHLTYWPGCGLPGSNFLPGTVVVACALGIAQPPSTYTGRLAAPEFTCAASGTIMLVHGNGNTSIIDNAYHEFSGANDESLAINCVPPRRPGDADGDGTVTSIDALLILQFEAGLLSSLPRPDNADLNRDGAVNAIDAELVLQIEAGLMPAP